MYPQFTPSEIASFWDRVDRTGDCWLWKRGRTKKGYGELKIYGKTWYAHRLSWSITNGEITAGIKVLHRCDNPPCVNPDHLFLGTSLDNTRDMISKGRDCPPPTFIGANHPRAILTEDQAMDILNRADPKKRNLSALAREYHISLQSVSRIARGKSWCHLSINTGRHFLE